MPESGGYISIYSAICIAEQFFNFDDLRNSFWRCEASHKIFIENCTCTRFEKYLFLHENSLTGNWDYPHNIQLTWHDVLNKKPYIWDTIKIYFSAMQSMRCGKASTHFYEKARKYCIKNYQSTRFVRALQRGITAALRNLPTLVSIIAEDWLQRSSFDV